MIYIVFCIPLREKHNDLMLRNSKKLALLKVKAIPIQIMHPRDSMVNFITLENYLELV